MKIHYFTIELDVFPFRTLSMFSLEKALQVQGLCAGAGDPTKHRIFIQWIGRSQKSSPESIDFHWKKGGFPANFPKKNNPLISSILFKAILVSDIEKTLPIRIPKFR